MFFTGKASIIELILRQVCSRSELDLPEFDD